MTSSQSEPTPADADRQPQRSGDTRLVRKAIDGAKTGDSEALHFLYVRYAPDVLRFVKSLVNDDHEAEDITQNVFVKLMSAIQRYEPREVPFAAWIQRVAHNLALDHMRTRRMVPCEDVRAQEDDHGQIDHERRVNLRQALEELPGEQREVLILRHILGLSPVEIAEVLGKTESSVHGLHHRGRLQLQSSLESLGAVPVVAPSRVP